MNKKVTIIGGGAIGLTTAITFQLFGVPTQIYTAERLDKFVGDMNANASQPEIASIHAAASSIPHTVFGPEINRYFQISTDILDVLQRVPEFGVHVQTHFEAFEHEMPAPYYQSILKNFEFIQDYKAGDLVPRRNGVGDIYGWAFDAHFMDVPHYLRALYNLYESLGGVITVQTVSRDDLFDIAKDQSAIVNCTGFDPYNLFEDEDAARHIYRGHYVMLHTNDAALNATGKRFSYNYTPVADIYRKQDGSSADLYFYPRSDGWLLGSSRQKGTIKKAQDVWNGEQTIVPEIELNNVKVPAVIYDLNAEIIQKLTGRDISAYKAEAGIGYRFENEEGVRVAVSGEIGNTLLLCNTGHCGAGYTLSWGTAIETFRLFCEMTDARPDTVNSDDSVLSDISSKLLKYI